jgi:hypothetical protein
MDVELTYDARIAVNWFIQCIGLAWVELKLQRIGDIDGPDQPDAPIISRSLSSYIDPITQEGIDVLFMQAGRWRLRTASTHQALHTKPGFMHGFARSTHTAEFVPLGDANGDGSVNVEDILVVLAQFGPCESCHGDLDGDGNVNVVDLLQVLADWSG